MDSSPSIAQPKIGPLLYQLSLAAIVIAVTFYLAYYGYDYYQTPLEERFYHPKHEWFKATGLFGHGLGIIGTLMIAIGVFVYIPAKKYGFLERFIRLKYLLEFHIFLCTLGPILILFHTTFKFGGIVSIAFWSMVLVVLSGVIGRYIYLQIPRSINGRELSLQEIRAEEQNLERGLGLLSKYSQEWHRKILAYTNPKKGLWARPAYARKFRLELKRNLKEEAGLEPSDLKSILQASKAQIAMRHKIERLELMQRLFRYWHVAHRPFALIMLFIVIVHVVITVAMGYYWIF